MAARGARTAASDAGSRFSLRWFARDKPNWHRRRSAEGLSETGLVEGRDLTHRIPLGAKANMIVFRSWWPIWSSGGWPPSSQPGSAAPSRAKSATTTVSIVFAIGR